MLPNANPVQKYILCVGTDLWSSDLDCPISCDIHFAAKVHED
jgi:hypothetical protein